MSMIIIELNTDLTIKEYSRAFKTLSELFNEMSLVPSDGLEKAELTFNDPITNKEIGTITSQP